MRLKQNRNPFLTEKVHYKMFKASHGWLVVGLTTFGLITASPLGIGHAKADTTPTTPATTKAAPPTTTTPSEQQSSVVLKTPTQVTKSTAATTSSGDNQLSPQSQAPHSTQAASQAPVDNKSVASQPVNGSTNSATSQNITTTNSNSSSAASVAANSAAKNSTQTSSQKPNSQVPNSQVPNSQSPSSQASGSQASSSQASSSQTPSTQVSTSNSQTNNSQNSTVSNNSGTSATKKSQTQTTSEQVNNPSTRAITPATQSNSILTQQNNGKVTINFEVPGQIAPKPVTVAQGTTGILLPADPKQTVPNDGKGGQYKFDGWYYKNVDGATNTKFDNTVPVTMDVTLTARFTRWFTTNFEAINTNGDHYIVSSGEVAENGTISEPTEVQKPDNLGHRFVYWYVNDIDNQTLIDQGQKPVGYQFGIDQVDKDLNLRGYYENVVRVDFVSDTAPVDPQYIPTGQQATAPIVNRAGYQLLGWATKATTKDEWNSDQSIHFNFQQPLNDDLTLYAVWDAQAVNYQVVYWVEKLDEYGQLIKTPVPGYNLVTKVSSGETALTDSQVSMSQADLEALLQKQTNIDNTNAINYAHFDHADQNVRILGNGQAIINVYYNLNAYQLNFNIDSSQNFIWSADGRTYAWAPMDTSNLLINGSPTSYTMTVYYGEDISADWPQITGYSMGTQGKYLVNSWTDHPNWDSQWITKRGQVNQDVLRNANSDGVVTLRPIFLLNTQAQNLSFFYYEESLADDPVDTTYKGVNYHRIDEFTDSATSIVNNFISKQLNGLTFVDYQKTTDPRTQRTIYSSYYSRNSYTFTVDSQIPGETPVSTNYKYQQALDLSDVTAPSRPGYNFLGWYLDPDGTQALDNEQGHSAMTFMPDRNVTIFAKWQQAKYHVDYFDSFDSLQAGTSLDNWHQSYGENDSIELPTDYQLGQFIDGHGMFAGWKYMNGNTAVPVNDDFLVNHDYQLFASYSEPNYHVSYDLQGLSTAVPTDSNAYGYDTVVRLATAPVVSGKVFSGWTYNGQFFLPNQFVRINQGLVDMPDGSFDNTILFTAVYLNPSEGIQLRYHSGLDSQNQSVFTYTVLPGTVVKLLDSDVLNVDQFKLLGWSSGDDQGNFDTTNQSLVGGSFQINQTTDYYAIWQPILTVNDGSKQFDGRDQTSDPTYTLNLPVDIKLPTEINNSWFDRQDGVNVGSYDLKLNATGIAGLQALNPHFDFSKLNLKDAIFTISKRKITITPDDKTMTIGDALPTYSATISNNDFVGSQPSYQLDSTADGKTVGDYPITVTFDPNVAANTNFDITPASGKLTVDPIPQVDGFVVFINQANNHQVGQSIPVSGTLGQPIDILDKVPSGMHLVDPTNSTVTLKQNGQSIAVFVAYDKRDVTINFVDKNQTVIGQGTINGVPDETHDVTSQVPAGYEVVGDGQVTIVDGETSHDVLVQPKAINYQIKFVDAYTMQSVGAAIDRTDRPGTHYDFSTSLPSGYHLADGAVSYVDVVMGQTDLVVKVVADSYQHEIIFHDENDQPIDGIESQIVQGNPGEKKAVTVPAGYDLVKGEPAEVAIDPNNPSTVIQIQLQEENFVVTFVDQYTQQQIGGSLSGSGRPGVEVDYVNKVPKGYHAVSATGLTIAKNQGPFQISVVADSYSNSVHFVDENGQPIVGLDPISVTGPADSSQNVQIPDDYEVLPGNSATVTIDPKNPSHNLPIRLKEVEFQISFVDQFTKKAVGQAQILTKRPGETVDITNLLPTGYQLVTASDGQFVVARKQGDKQIEVRLPKYDQDINFVDPNGDPIAEVPSQTIGGEPGSSVDPVLPPDYELVDPDKPIVNDPNNPSSTVPIQLKEVEFQLSFVDHFTGKTVGTVQKLRKRPGTSVNATDYLPAGYQLINSSDGQFVVARKQGDKQIEVRLPKYDQEINFVDPNGDPIAEVPSQTIGGEPGSSVDPVLPPDYELVDPDKPVVNDPNNPSTTVPIRLKNVEFQISFVDQFTKKAVGQAQTLTKRPGETVDITNLLPTGYQLVTASDGQFVVVRKQSDKQIEVRLPKYDQDINFVDPNGDPIAEVPSQTIGGEPGSSVDPVLPPDYELVDPDKPVVIDPNDPSTVVPIQLKKVKYNVTFVDKYTKQQVGLTLSQEQRPGESFDFSQNVPVGYHLFDVMTAQGTVIRGQKDLQLEVLADKYNHDVIFVDGAGKPIADAPGYTVEGGYGEIVPIKVPDDYELINPGDAVVTFDPNNPTSNIAIQFKDVKFNVMFIDSKTGKPVGAQLPQTGKPGTLVDVTKDLPQYYDAVDPLTFIIQRHQGDVNIKIKQRQFDNEIHFVDQNHQVISGLPIQSIQGVAGQEVPVNVPTDYQLVAGQPTVVAISPEQPVHEIQLELRDVQYQVVFVDQHGQTVAQTGSKTGKLHDQVDMTSELPAKYHPQNPSDMIVTLTGSEDPIKIVVIHDETTTDITFVDETGKPVGHEQVVDQPGAQKPVQFPDDYEPVNNIDKIVILGNDDQAITIPVREKQYVVDVEFVDQTGKVVTTEQVQGHHGDLKHVASMVPKGYQVIHENDLDFKVDKNQPTVQIRVTDQMLVMVVFHWWDDPARTPQFVTQHRGKIGTTIDVDDDLPENYYPYSSSIITFDPDKPIQYVAMIHDNGDNPEEETPETPIDPENPSDGENSSGSESNPSDGGNSSGSESNPSDGGNNSSGSESNPSDGGNNSSGSESNPSDGGNNSSGSESNPSDGGNNSSGSESNPSDGGNNSSGSESNPSDGGNNSSGSESNPSGGENSNGNESNPSNGENSNGSESNSSNGENSNGNESNSSNGENSNGNESNPSNGENSNGNESNSSNGENSNGNESNSSNGENSNGNESNSSNGENSNGNESNPSGGENSSGSGSNPSDGGNSSGSGSNPSDGGNSSGSGSNPSGGESSNGNESNPSNGGNSNGSESNPSNGGNSNGSESNPSGGENSSGNDSNSNSHGSMPSGKPEQVTNYPEHSQQIAEPVHEITGTVDFVDGNGRVIGQISITGQPGEVIDISMLIPAGYRALGSTKVVLTQAGQIVYFNVKAVKNSSAVLGTVGQPKQNGPAVTKGSHLQQQLPQTDETNQQSLGTLLGMMIVTILGWFGISRRRHND